MCLRPTCRRVLPVCKTSQKSMVGAIQTEYRIRVANRGDLHVLPKIERAAALRFAEFDLADVMAGTEMSLEQFEQRQTEGRLWVAVTTDHRPVGFASVSEIDDCGHLEELDVLPAHGRSGLGTRLLDAVCEWVRERGRPAITLSTMREIPWNAPFYAARGFVELPEQALGTGLLRLRAAEAEAGLPTERRVIMRKLL